MRPFILIVVFLSFNITHVLHGKVLLDSVLVELDKALEHHEDYLNLKLTRIDNLKSQMRSNASSLERQYYLNMDLFYEYKAFKCDSAIHYLNQSIATAHQLQNATFIHESKLKLSYLMASAGMYLESVEVLGEIERKALPEALLELYYSTYNHIYGELAHYTQNDELSRRYRTISNNYSDSLFNNIPDNDESKYVLQELRYLYNNQSNLALEINDKRIASIKMGTPEYALAAYHRSLIYASQGQRELQKYYLGLSALSDIRSAIKDHASLWTLAQLLYQDGDLARAYNYIRFSWNDIIFYNARLRTLQGSGILSMIEKTYLNTIETQKSQLQKYLILISALTLLLIVALVYIYRQMKRLSIARQHLQDANNQLKLLNVELNKVNTQLRAANLDLSESNQIKEVYIGRFVKLSSTYIEKIDAYRRMVNKNLLNGKVDELKTITQSQDAMLGVFEELYANFDAAFLDIFPDFVDKVNQLLIEEQKLTLKKGELLNVELRILALIRLGIHDSSQIADFLRYSVNTIYNYRAKVRNRAIARDEFEEQLLLIK